MQLFKCKEIGYCHGVEKTISNAEICLEKAKLCNLKAYCIGNLIHNEHVVQEYNSKGLVSIKNPNGIDPGVALVRAHGIPDSLRSEFLNSGFELIDSTCVNIKASIQAMRRAYAKGRSVVVVGLKNHAETLTLTGVLENGKPIACYELNDWTQVSGLKDKVSEESKISLVVQTTYNQHEYEKILRELTGFYSDIVEENTFCKECIKRKQSASELAESCDAVIVVGSATSANTAELARWIMEKGTEVFFVQDDSDLTDDLKKRLSSYNKVGLCSGTSTPEKIITAVEKALCSST